MEKLKEFQRFLTTIIILTLATGVYPSSASAQTDSYWEEPGGPYGSEVVAMAINSNGHVFAGTISAGVYRSTDNGNTWRLVANGLSNT